jgi:hypothetical protein
MFKKHKSHAPQPLLDDACITLLSDEDMDKILGGFQEPELSIMPSNPTDWDAASRWTDPLLD